jgi:hypothetical protein
VNNNATKIHFKGIFLLGLIWQKWILIKYLSFFYVISQQKVLKWLKVLLQLLLLLKGYTSDYISSRHWGEDWITWENCKRKKTQYSNEK